MKSEQRMPSSCGRWFDPLMIAITCCAVYALAYPLNLSDQALALLLCTAVTVVMGGIEVYFAAWRKMPRVARPLRVILKDTFIKFNGMMLGLCFTLLFWSVFSMYDAFLSLALAWLPLACVCLALGIFFTEWRLGAADDATRHLGLCVLGRWKELDTSRLWQALLGWAIRGIFLPLNFNALVSFLSRIRGYEADVLHASWPQVQYRICMIFSVLLTAAIVPGYLFGSRLLCTQIRKVDATWQGWLVTLSCYPPLLYVVFTQGLNFYPHVERVMWGAPWLTELQAWPQLAFTVGLLVMGLEVLHYWGEASFHLRSSNLSNRGIITSGLYRWCKHPIYVVKCIIWLLWMPFLAGDTPWQCVWLTLLWAGACSIYAARAWVEEKLLSEDPDYVVYARHMDTHGLFAWVGRRIPMFRYEWRLKRWQLER